MLFDFVQQVLYSIILFLGISGAGLFLVRLFGFDMRNVARSVALAYFFSLCFYTLLSVGVLFLFPDKLVALRNFTWVYGVTSLFSWAIFLKKDWLEIRLDVFWSIIQHRRLQVLAGLFVIGTTVFLVFLQAYHTSILDEWLHRPVVKSFTENGVFPLVNPLSPTANFIQMYHYGTQVVASAWRLVTGLGVSESLDLVKFGTFIGFFLLLYGMIREWTHRRLWALLGAAVVLFCGSSFFFFDSFSMSHLFKIKGMDQTGPINAPLSYMLMAITGIGTPVTIAFMVLIEEVFYRKKHFTVLTMGLSGILLVGFFILTELFAFIVTGCLGLVILYSIFRGHLPWKQTVNIAVLGIGIFVGILYGVYATGGVMGDLIANKVRTFQANSSVSKFVNLEAKNDNQEVVSNMSNQSSPPIGLLTLRAPSQWGFPTESTTLVIWERPLFYLRSVLLEVGILLFVVYAIWRKKVAISEQPIFWLLMISSLVVPFIFSTSMGDYNLTKTTALGFVLIHLAFFLTVAKMGITKPVAALFGILFLFGMLPGMLMGPNIQWRWISNKGGNIYCSQNPLCYKDDQQKAMIAKFAEAVPGFKKVLASTGDAQQLVDLTNAYVYTNTTAFDPDTLRQYGIQYIFNSPGLRKKLSSDSVASLNQYRSILSDAGYSILKVE